VATTVVMLKDTTRDVSDKFDMAFDGRDADKTFKRSEVMLEGRVVHDKDTNSDRNRWLPSMNASNY
jgi:hypothetical protein